jgi:hypothetical protein
LIVNIFKNSQPATFIVIPVFMLIAWVFARQTGSPLLVDNPMPLYNLVAGILADFPLWLAGLTGYLVATSQVLHLNYIVNKHEVLYKNSYLPALFYMVFLAIIPQFLTIHPVLFVNSIILIIIDKLFRIYKHPAPLQLIFDSFFLIAVASLIYLPAMTFLLLALFAILILKTFSWRDWLVGLTGFLLPLFFIFVFYFWNDGLFELREKFLFKNIRELWDPGGIMMQGYRITLVIAVIMFVLTAIRIRQNFYKNVTRIRNFQQVIFITLGVGLLSLAFTAGSLALYRFSILVIPYAIMVSYYFLAAKKQWLTEVLFWALIGVVLFNYISSSGPGL